ncbi:MAG: phosphonate ABC transporter, permease protein PhnE [Candidatus Limnocylindrales bacterium]
MGASIAATSAEPGRPVRALLSTLGIVAAIVIVRQLAIDTEVDLPKFGEYAPNMLRIGSGVFNPDLDVLPMLGKFARETIEIAVLGTLIGALLAIPVSFFAARNLMRRTVPTTGLYYLVRAVLSVIRTVPTLLWGLLFLVAAGPGPFAGVLAISAFTVGILAKLYSEAIESIDWGQIEAVTAAGGSPLHIIRFGVLPQVFPFFVAHTLYGFEINTHSAFVLGFIGAGGMGFIILEFIQQFMYRATGTALIVTAIMTLSIDYSSAWLRARIL